MKILALESTAKAASAALWEDGKLLGEHYTNTGMTHSQTLMPMAEALLNCTGIDLSQVDLFAVAEGPGSFTGVRIGVASVKGMAMGANKPCVGVSALLAMAENLRHVEGVICAVMDARCGQVYNALFEAHDGELRRLTDDRALAAKDLAEECENLKKNIFLVGDGANLCYNRESFSAFAVLAPEHLRYQRASGVAIAAYEAFGQGLAVSAGALQPIYLRLPQAERELKKRGGTRYEVEL